MLERAPGVPAGCGRRTALALLTVALATVPLPAQRLDPAQWSLAVEPAAAAPGSTVVGRLTVTLEDDWHLYSPTTSPGGPIPTTIELDVAPGITGYEVYQRPPATAFDPNFQIETETFEHAATFPLLIRISADAAPGDLELTARVRYQLCTGAQCLPPRRKTATARLRVDGSAERTAAKVPEGFLPATRTSAPAQTASAPPAAAPAGEAPAPVRRAPEDAGLLRFLLVAFGFGLAAIFTPCVFPMIPITVSFFLNRRDAGRGGGIVQALVFCLGIVILFTALGLVTTAALGPFGVVQLGSNPWVNTFIAVVFLVFGLSLLGAFELTLPSSLLTRLNAASDRGGAAGTLLMGLTFSLTAFACVGPFVGTLLAASIGGGGIRPLVGMAAFASGLALPFFFLALFPSYLQRLPRAGGWMARVKVVLGFIILAAMLKYLSNIDQVMQWGLLPRGRFLAIWAALFALAGLYLLGLVRLEGADPQANLGVVRVLAGGAFLALAISLIPGMLGGRLGELDAYVPPADQGAPGAGVAGGAPAWLKNVYEEALQRAAAENKLLLVSFTGYACTNCHWMKANMFTRPEVAAALARHVLVELYTDGTDAASERNQRLQEEKFATVAIPYYALIDPKGGVVAAFAGLTRDPDEFLRFLNSPANAR